LLAATLPWLIRKQLDACVGLPVAAEKAKIVIIGLVESLQSHFILTMSHWSSGLPVCILSQGTRVKIPQVLMWNGDSPVSVVSLH
jgi:hypothetical protein